MHCFKALVRQEATEDSRQLDRVQEFRNAYERVFNRIHVCSRKKELVKLVIKTLRFLSVFEKPKSALP